MGVVYKAKDTKLGRVVALKFLPPQWSHDEGAKQRFLREAQAASAINHPNICVIHDIEQTADGRLFIVMAYCEGQTLKQKLEGGALPVADAIDIAAGVAEGLAKAHAQGVVHRDIKPGNLIVTEDGVKIVDFGLAKFADALQLTQPGSTLGTVAYMAPEQARGEEADERSDVWALGVVLYEMLTGEVPFKGTYPEAIFYAIKNELPPALSGGGREIPETVERIVLRALTKDPAERFQHAREMARELRFLQGRSLPLDLRTEPVAVPGSATAARPRRRALAWVGVCAAALAIGAAGGYFWLARPLPRTPVAIVPVANHTGEPALDGYRLALTQTLAAELSDSPNLRVAPYLRVVEIIRRFIDGSGDVSSRDAIQAVATHGGARLIIVPAIAYRDRDSTWLAQAELRNVETGTNVATLETEAVTSSLPKETAHRLMASLAERIQAQFKVRWPRTVTPRPIGSRFRTLDAARAFEEGLNAYEQMEYSAALAAFRRAADADPQRAITQAWLGRVLIVLRESSEAEAAGQRARQLLTAETPRADALFVEATQAESHGDLAGAEARYRELGNLDPGNSSLRLELADFLKRQYRDQAAVDAYHDVLRVDPAYIRPHVDLCQLYTRLGEHPLADEQAQAALKDYRDAGSRGGEGQALLCLGELRRVQGGDRLAEAGQHIAAARVIFEALGGPYNLARVYQYSGTVAFTGRNYREAVQSFEQALSRNREVGNRFLEGTLLMNLGVTHLKLGQRRQALDYYEQSRDFYEGIGETLRAAEAEVDVAGLLVDYGSDQDEVLRRISNARATLRKLGVVDFEILAIQIAAAVRWHAGLHDEALRQLREALNIAKERQLKTRIVSVNVNIAQSQFLRNEYDAARTLLEDVMAGDVGRDDLEARIALGRVYVRLGDFDAARQRLQRIAEDTEASGQMEFASIAHVSLGELAFESGKLDEARQHFGNAAAQWTEDLPDAASVEARCYLGLLDAVAGKTLAARRSVEVSVEQAARMGRLYLEARCRLTLARIDVGEGRYGDALAVLDRMPPDGDRTIGPELRAEVHYWRSRAMAQRGSKAEAESEAVLARTLARQLQASLPPAYRDRFASRPEIRPLIQ